MRRYRMEKIVNCFCKQPDAVARLICFPWAGGGSVHYARWGKIFNCSIEVYSVKLPGREARAKEPFAVDIHEIVNEVTQALLPQLQEKPFAFFGHSFGALTSFATAEYLKRVYGLEPTHLFVSGSSAPHSIARTTSQKTSELPDKEFLEWMTTVGGTPPEILGNPEVVNLFLPVLKADLRVVENYSYLKPPSSVLSCAITAFDGTEDVPHDIDAWKELTSGEFTKQMLPGSHFYLKDPQNEAHLVKYITKCLETTEIDYI
ncbi:S-acyl fatty acid synthase thioesterase, medium chain isoform X1 [Polypterus senegalus]|uniref:S-acyl fatty acid synthase thioesterase, medium chain isoform X1 n=2 Tax=Polypterus senegalus TaxID=55291 RepID=UPI0019646188|nr:S-acyl fatty acid synthase thioesterase, medium chain isoform X1 [Polypterus senegalus]XP_039592434.1 S-acyl fatty acid synthase thioesterase, medium chain isoform X1 [Polypterus senegalus]